MRRRRDESFGLSAADLRTLRALKTPERIQRFIDALAYQYADTAWSPSRVLRERKGHCLEGALVAAAALRVHGHPPLLMDLESVHDDDHVVALFRARGLWGGIAKSNFAGLRFRPPVYRSLRELALSYFAHYYNLLAAGGFVAIRPLSLDDGRGGPVVGGGGADCGAALPARSRQGNAGAAAARPPQLCSGNAWLGEALKRQRGGESAEPRSSKSTKIEILSMTLDISCRMM